MATQKIALLIHKGKEIAQKLHIIGGQNGVGAQGQPVIIQAQAGAKYQLALEENGLAPENLGVKRVGKDLHVAFEGGDVDTPDLIIEDYYTDTSTTGHVEAANQELIGLHENGNMYSFVPESAMPAEAVSVLAEGAEAAQVLGGALGAGPAALAFNPALLAPLLGLAGVGGGGGGGGGAAAPAPSRVIPAPSINQVTDDQNPQPLGATGDQSIANGGKTNDGTPLVSGTVPALQAGDKVNLYATVDGTTTKVGSYTAAAGDTAWSVQDNTGYADGKTVTYHTKVEDVAGNESTTQSADWAVTMDRQSMAAEIGDVGRDSDRDGKLELVQITNVGNLRTAGVETIKLVDDAGNVLATQSLSGLINGKFVDVSANQLSVGQSFAAYTYDDLGNVAISQQKNVDGSIVVFQNTNSVSFALAATDSSNNAVLVQAGNNTPANNTDDNKLAFEAKLTLYGDGSGTPSTSGYKAFLYDNGKQVVELTNSTTQSGDFGTSNTNSTQDGNADFRQTWTIGDSYLAPDYADGTKHDFKVVIYDAAGNQVSAETNVLAVQKNDTGTLHVNSALLGDDAQGNPVTELTLSQVLDHDNNPSTPSLDMVRVKGDSSDTLDIGLESGTHWVKTGTASYTSDSNTYDVYQRSSDGVQIIVDSDIQLI